MLPNLTWGVLGGIVCMYYKKGGRCDVTWRLGIHTLGSLPGDLSLSLPSPHAVPAVATSSQVKSRKYVCGMNVCSQFGRPWTTCTRGCAQKVDYIEDVSDTQYIVLHVRYDDSRRDSQLEGMQVCKERQRSRSSWRRTRGITNPWYLHT